MKKPIASDKVIKYARARALGKTKKESKAIAGYSENTMPHKIESSEAYKGLSVKNALLSHISLDEITEEHSKMIKQSDDKGVKVNAIKLAYERIEPENTEMDDVESITVLLKG